MAYRQRKGQQTPPTSEPERVKPVPEHYAGVNFPYRGIENHGVAMPEDSHFDTREFQHDQETPEDYLPEIEEIEPVPVRIVEESSNERLEWRAAQVFVNDTPTQIVGRLDCRRSLRIRLPSLSFSVTIAPDSNVSSYVGWPMEQATELNDLRSTEEFWGVCAAGESATLLVMYELAVYL